MGGIMTRFIVPEEINEITLKDFLRKNCGISLTGWRKIKQSNTLKVNDICVSPGRAIVAAQDIITYELPSPSESPIIPNDIFLDILYEDEYLLVIDKPAHMLVHPTASERENTLANGVLFYYRQNNLTLNYHPVHRLDKNTSGLVLIAKYPHIQHQLSRALEKKSLMRDYIAFVHNKMKNPMGTIHLPIARHPNSIIERIVAENGQVAITHYEVVESYDDACQVHLSLETGRTHQIRVHLSHLGHPIIGDDLYGSPSSLINRQALHAYKLSFLHPVSKKQITVHSSLPNDMNNLLTKLKNPMN